MFIVQVKSPQGEVTRMVFGCEEPAMLTGRALHECGFEVEGDELETPPQRTTEELVRAEQLLKLVFEPAQGQA